MDCISLVCSPEEAKDWEALKKKITLTSGKTYQNIRWKKRSLDARSRHLKINATFECSDDPLPNRIRDFSFKEVHHASAVHIVGAGPAGLFAALQALLVGKKPILFERGKRVKDRRRDLAQISKRQTVDHDSNYCFGEGGAGTYSDGKLYTRSKKRGEVDLVLELLVFFGAPEEILVDAHPHIGTNKLPSIIENIRTFILSKGGEIHFEAKVTGIEKKNNKINQLEINGNQWCKVDQVILATGHSARDIFYLLHREGIKLLAKPFALGVRVEHSQEVIDKIQYHGRINDEYVPPASYRLVEQIEGKGVYSFCMCPGGIIAPCATKNGEVVTNGWSPSKRNNPYANAGIVVSIDPTDFEDAQDPLVCLRFQQAVEQTCFKATGDNQKVPAQRLMDFVEGKTSDSFPRSSYFPGIESARIDLLLPAFVAQRLQKAFRAFDKKMPGFLTNDAVVHAPESRTSSPVLIPRNPEKLHHVDITNLYPCAEGAGYAGGIVSAAIDGMKCMAKVAEEVKS
ncbi:MAG: NAD(P)/FAD-dependent oxidoreductase [Flavobacteriales bacterium]|jgi:uncharacterized FAD-dependent dehydrogenase